jgi:hypothetical protein
MGVSSVGRFSLVILVVPEAPYKTLERSAGTDQSESGKFNIGTTNIGATQHLAAELLKSMARLDAVTITYSTTGALLSECGASAFSSLSNSRRQSSGKSNRAACARSPFRPRLAIRRCPNVPDCERKRCARLYECDLGNGLGRAREDDHVPRSFERLNKSDCSGAVVTCDGGVLRFQEPRGRSVAEHPGKPFQDTNVKA